MGAYLQGVSFLLIAGYLVHSLFAGKKAPANPWGAATLEWSCTSPPPHDNFSSPPEVGDPYEHSNIVYDDRLGGYVRDNTLAKESATKAPIPRQPAGH
jgi:cytochrome c oxidase subunit 1